MRGAAILIGLIPITASAQPKTSFTLEEAIALAQEQTRAVVRAKADLEIMDAQRAQALAAVLPSLRLRNLKPVDALRVAA